MGPGMVAVIATLLGCQASAAAHASLSPAELRTYLASTPFLDSDNPKMVAATQRVIRGHSSPLDRARALYEFVRDGANETTCDSYVASDVLECGGNLCYQRAILLVALARAAGIPSRLHLQRVKIVDWACGKGAPHDLTFAHGIAGVFVDGEWRLLEPVGNALKWEQWTCDPARASEMPLAFSETGDTLFPSGDRIRIETLPASFADRSPDMISMIEAINDF